MQQLAYSQCAMTFNFSGFLSLFKYSAACPAVDAASSWPIAIDNTPLNVAIQQKQNTKQYLLGKL